MFICDSDIDSFTVSLHSPNGKHLLDVRAVQGGCQWPLKNVSNSDLSCEPTIHCDWDNPGLYLDHPMKKGWCQPFADHVSYPSHNLNGTKLGLYQSLAVRVFQDRRLPFYYAYATTALLLWHIDGLVQDCSNSSVLSHWYVNFSTVPLLWFQFE